MKNGDFPAADNNKPNSLLPEGLIMQLETPCVVIDVEKARENIRRMQQAADNHDCKLRPHVKTHKIPYFARMQMEMGAAGITCSKVSEAEVMAEGGLQDIFIAYPLIGSNKIRRALSLSRRVKRLILAVDSLEGANFLEQAAGEAGVVLEVRMEVDTGAARTGVEREAAVRLAMEIKKLPHLRLTGIYTFKSLVYQNAPTTDTLLAAKEEGDLMESVSEKLRQAGIPIEEISAGSTPTGEAVAATGKVTEIRPGTYIFNDFMLTKEGHCEIGDIAGRICATVVSTPRPDYAVIDGGTKTFPMDIPLDAPPYCYPGYAVVEGIPDLALRRMNEEHGMLSSRLGNTGLHVGQVVALIPIHICTAINMQNSIYLHEYGELRKVPVAARGMLV